MRTYLSVAAASLLLTITTPFTVEGQKELAYGAHGVMFDVSNPDDRITLGAAYNFYDSMPMGTNNIWGWGRGIGLAYAPETPKIKTTIVSAKSYVYVFAGKFGPYAGLKGVFKSDLRSDYSLYIAPEVGLTLYGYFMFFISLHAPIMPSTNSTLLEVGVHLFLLPLSHSTN